VALCVLLADDHAMVRQGVRALLEREQIVVIAEADNGSDAIRLAEQFRPDVAVLDYAMPRCDGLSAAHAIRKSCPHTATIILTIYPDEHHVVGALRAGVRGYVLKTQVADDLIRAVRQVAQGGFYLSPNVAESIADAIFLGSAASAASPLTGRERQVLKLVAEGKTIKDSAELLKVSVKSAESYRARLMTKLDIHTTAGLVRFAIRQGIIDPCIIMFFRA
jgi:two-component system, NarL family, response regulator NreC